MLTTGPNGSIYTHVTTAPKGIARLTSFGSLDTSFSGDGFLDINSFSGKVFAKNLTDGSLVVVSDGQILRLTEEGLPITPSSSLVYLDSSHPNLVALPDVKFFDVVRTSATTIKVLGCYRRYFGSSSKIQIFSFDSEPSNSNSEVVVKRIRNHALLDLSEVINKAVFDDRQNIIFSYSKTVAIQDILNKNLYTTNLNDGSYRKTVSDFSNLAYHVSDFITEPGRLIVLSGHAVQALRYPDDSDGDGLWDSSESSLRTDSQSSDSDADGVSDWAELVVWDLDPLNSDSDYDGIPDSSEVDGFTAKATASVTLGSLVQTYDGISKSATASTDPAGKTVVFTYDGGASVPANAGFYAVVGTINDSYYQGSATGTLQIARAAQTISFPNPGPQFSPATVNLAATGGASGNPVTITVTSGPASITNGVLSFSGAGSVTITASQSGSANYEAAPSVSCVFTVTKANATVTIGNLSQTFDGTPKSATATTDPSGKTVTFTYEGSTTAPTNAGSYAVVSTIDDAIYQGSANGTLTIAKAAQTITFANPGAQLANATVNLSATGGASGNPATFIVEGPGTLSVGNVLSFTGAGSVTVRASQAGNSGFDPASDVTHTFDVVLPQPDVAVGLALDSLVGLRSYGYSGQQINLVSRFARPVTGFAALANRTILSDRRAADRLAVQANAGDRFFRINYSDVDGNATAGIVSGFYRTPAIDGTDALRWLTARISPNKALLSEKKGKRTVYLRKTFTTRIRASSTLYPPASDSGVIEVLHQ
jgi:hypothetical protein